MPRGGTTYLNELDEYTYTMMKSIFLFCCHSKRKYTTIFSTRRDIIIFIFKKSFRFIKHFFFSFFPPINIDKEISYRSKSLKKFFFTFYYIVIFSSKNYEQIVTVPFHIIIPTVIVLHAVDRDT